MVERIKNDAVPVYSASIKHLTQAETVSVICTCGHIARVPVILIRATLPPGNPISTLHRHMRCRVCNTKGDCRVDALAALGWHVSSP